VPDKAKKLQIADFGVGDELIVNAGLRHPINGRYEIRALVDGLAVVRSFDDKEKTQKHELLSQGTLDAIADCTTWKKLQ
jgi:hypothetical protein